MWYFIIILLTIIYILINTIFPQIYPFEINLLASSLWLILALFSLRLAQYQDLNILYYRKTRKWTLGQSPIHAGLFIGGFQISLLIIIGLFAGFGKNHYSFAPDKVLFNIIYVTTFLLGTELSRAYLIKYATNKRIYTTITFTLITLVFVITRIQLSDLSLLSFSNPSVLLEFLGGIILPAITINLLASYLAYLGGASASISYLGVLLAFEWFSPIIPNTHWTLLALVGTIAPAVGYTLIHSAENLNLPKKHHRRRLKTSEQGWTAVAIFSVVIVFFSFGFFGVNPTVIYSGSMQPTLNIGDIVLIQKTSIENLKQGDIIQFKKDNNTFVHRIYSNTADHQQIVLITKRAANAHPDPNQITSDQILGKSLFTIPQLGWIKILIQNTLRDLGAPIG